MSPEMIGILGIIALLILFMLKVPIGISLLFIGFLGTSLVRNWDIGFTQLGRTFFDTASSYPLSVIPLFILMGMILSHTGIGSDLYRAVDSWIGHLQGGLAMATLGTASIFSAISGSLNATTATVAKIALPEMDRYKYKPELSTASIAAGGTLGVLIPPSVVLILYGILTREPIGKLLIAGIIPGVLQLMLFLITVYLLVKANPALAPTQVKNTCFKEKLTSLTSIWPFLGIFIVTIGGIYLGVFTPTEAAGIGAFSSLFFSIVAKKMTWKKFTLSFNETVRLSAYIFLILIGATLFSQFITITRIPVKLTELIGTMELNAYIILALILITLLILGCFIEGLSLIVLTIPIIYPIVTDLGFDGVWFGVIIVLAINIGALTPPLGVSVYVIKGVARHIPIQTIFRGVMPMIAAMIICILLLIIFPSLVTVLPDTMK